MPDKVVTIHQRLSGTLQGFQEVWLLIVHLYSAAVVAILSITPFCELSTVQGICSICFHLHLAMSCQKFNKLYTRDAARQR